MGRVPANTKLSSNVAIRTVRVRGGHTKFRALRLDTGNFSWGSEVRPWRGDLAWLHQRQRHVVSGWGMGLRRRGAELVLAFLGFRGAAAAAGSAQLQRPRRAESQRHASRVCALQQLFQQQHQQHQQQWSTEKKAVCGGAFGDPGCRRKQFWATPWSHERGACASSCKLYRQWFSLMGSVGAIAWSGYRAAVRGAAPAAGVAVVMPQVKDMQHAGTAVSVFAIGGASPARA